MPNAYDSWRTGVQIDNIYPVGSIYLSVNATNPRNLFGGTWEEIQGYFLIGRNSTYTAGSTGGSATMAHTHSQVAVTTGASSAANSGAPSNNTSGSTAITVAQMPSHTHNVYIDADDQAGWQGKSAWSGSGNIFKDVVYQWRASGSHQNLDASGRFVKATGSGSGHTHTLSSHTHTIAHTHSIAATTTGAASNTNNLPPYLAVYMWKRVA